MNVLEKFCETATSFVTWYDSFLNYEGYSEKNYVIFVYLLKLGIEVLGKFLLLFCSKVSLFLLPIKKWVLFAIFQLLKLI